MVVDVRSAARMRALALAMREASGGGGLRVVRVLRKEVDGVGRFWAMRDARSWAVMSIEVVVMVLVVSEMRLVGGGVMVVGVGGAVGG